MRKGRAIASAKQNLFANIKCLDLTPTFPPSETFVGEADSFPYKTIANLTMAEAAASDMALVSGLLSAGP